MSDAKRHHQLPQFYLRQFAKNDKVGVVRFGETIKRFPAHVKNVAVENSFYDVDWLGGERKADLERFLGRVEDAAATSLNGVLAGDIPSYEDRYNLSAWITLQYSRGRGGRSDSVGMQKFMMRANMAVQGKDRFLRQAEELGIDDGEEQWDRIVVRGDLADPPTARYGHARTMVRLTERIAPVYARAHWRIVRFRRHGLMTSDEPVCLWKEPSEDPGVGLLTADLVSIPLSRDTLLALSPGRQDSAFIEDPPTTLLWKGAITNSWLHAGEILVHHPDDEIPAWLPERPISSGSIDFPEIEQFLEMGRQFTATRRPR